MFYPTCIYGFIEDKHKYILNYDLLEEFNCYIYVEDLCNKYNSKSGIYYGVECTLDKNTGQIIISDEDKLSVYKLYKQYVEFHKNINQHFEEPEIGYYYCLSGEIDFYNKTYYIFNDTINEEESENGDEDD
jgi:hypothetical protein